MQPSIGSLNFDTYGRLSGIADALEAAGIPKGARVLDVGGHPGLLAQMLAGQYWVVTADFPATGHSPYVRASGTSLPFRDGAFDAVVSSDTLEHVCPQLRPVFLAEIWRVAGRCALLGAPFATPGVREAEAALSGLEAASRAGTNPWLAQHAQHGLPSLAETWQAFEAPGGACVAWPNGSLVQWFLLFAAQMLLEDVTGGTEALGRFMPDCNRYFGQDAGGAVYRHLLAAVKRGPVPKAFLAQRPYLRHEDLPGPDSDPAAAAQVDALRRLFDSVGAALRRQAELGAKGGALQAGYAEQLENALRQQDERLLQLEKSIAACSKPLLTRIARRIRHFIWGRQ